MLRIRQIGTIRIPVLLQDAVQEILALNKKIRFPRCTGPGMLQATTLPALDLHIYQGLQCVTEPADPQV